MARLLPPESAWTAAARLDAVLTTAAMDEAAKGAWCREHRVYAQVLQRWRENATQALAELEEVRDEARVARRSWFETSPEKVDTNI